MYEILVGLDVADQQLYQQYRNAMTPLLQQYGGDFGYDFIVSAVLRSAVAEPINRVFTIHFPDEAAKQNFFADAAYLQVKQQYFEQSVRHTTIIAAYQTAV